MADEKDPCEQLSGGEIHTGFFRGPVMGEKALIYSVINGQAVFEGDIILGSADAMAAEADARRSGDAIAQGIAITGQSFRWPNGIVPFTIDPTLASQQRVRDAITHWETNTSIRFVERTVANQAQHPNWVTFQPGGGCSSQVGMRGGQQFVTLGNGCTTGNAIHEIGHVLGLWHEQSRQDRDTFVTIQWANIQPNASHNFNQHVTDGDDIGAYDYGSIMHYPRDAFSQNGQDTIVPVQAGAQIGQRAALSAGDIAAIRAIYPTKSAQKDTKDRKDLAEGKLRKDQKDRKDRKDQTKEFAKERLKERAKEGKEFAKEGFKEGKEGKDTKDFKDRKDRFELQPPFDRSQRPSASDVDERLTAIEASVAQLQHFIEAGTRPNLDTSALSHEADFNASLEDELRTAAEQAEEALSRKMAADYIPR